MNNEHNSSPMIVHLYSNTPSHQGEGEESRDQDDVFTLIRKWDPNCLYLALFVCSSAEGSWKGGGTLRWDCNCVIRKWVYINQPTPLNMIQTRTTRPLFNSLVTTQPSLYCLPQYSPVSVVSVLTIFTPTHAGVWKGAEQMLTQLAV